MHITIHRGIHVSTNIFMSHRQKANLILFFFCTICIRQTNWIFKQGRKVSIIILARISTQCCHVAKIAGTGNVSKCEWCKILILRYTNGYNLSSRILYLCLVTEWRWVGALFSVHQEIVVQSKNTKHTFTERNIFLLSAIIVVYNQIHFIFQFIETGHPLRRLVVPFLLLTN